MANAPELTPSEPCPPPPSGVQDYVRPMHIGAVAIDRPFALAPMSGVTDSAFRRTVQAASGGTVGLLVTEFISIEGLTRKNLKSAMRMAFDPIVERPLSVQIFGAEIARMADAARMVADAGAQIVDINCGCPAPKVVRRGGGAELLRQADHLARLVEATAAAVAIPVTVKIRSGWSADTVNAVDIARRCEAAGARMIAVHGRTRMQMYTGEADWSVVDAVARAVGVPVFGSGDVATAQQALWRLRTTAAAGVMIGRAAIMNPWIFGQIDDAVRGAAVRDVTPLDRLGLLRSFRDLQRERLPEHAVPGRLKQLLARMTKGFAHGTLLRERAMRSATTDEMFQWIESFFEALQSGGLPAWCDRARAGLPGHDRASLPDQADPVSVV
ncbi:MAG: tRNA-dihydrouridine synthase family protein [Deltaproteobacteria bacterium]|nr:tRNA-dihydrouridine synthase family protein [Deltaproteobacteria bacterium]